MKTDAYITAAMATAFAQKLDGPATPEALRPYSDALTSELTAKMGEGTYARVTADCDNETLVVTVTNHGLRVREQRTVPFAKVGAKAPPRRKTDDNPAPETAPVKNPPKK